MTHAVKRLLAMILTTIMLAATVPLAFSGSFVFPVLSAVGISDTYVKPTASSGDIVKISTATDWLKFADDSTGSDGTALFKGKTVLLQCDIDLSNLSAVGTVSKPIPSVKGFEGSFDGQNHKIIIPDKGEFYANGTGVLGSDAGLFRQINNGGSVKNLIVQLKGELLLTNDGNSYNAGVVAGMVANSAILQNAAVIGDNSSCKFTIKYSEVVSTPNRYYGTVAGWLCGMPNNTSGGSTMSGCFSDVILNYEAPLVPYSQANAFLGGIVGDINGDNTVLQNCIYRGQKINYQAKRDSRISDISVSFLRPVCIYVYEGGISGYAAHNSKVMNCFVFQPTFSFNNLSDATSQTPYYGKIVGGKTDSAQVINCHGMGGGAYSGNISSAVANNTGSVTAAPKAATLGAYWVDTLEGYPNLKWLVAAPTDVTVNAKSDPPTLAITPSYPNSDGSYDATTDAHWAFDISIPTMGVMPTPLGVDPIYTVSNVTIERPTNEYFKGSTYYFGAKVTGVMVEANKPEVTWSAKDSNTNAVITMDSDGKLAIPSNFSGSSITVTATCDGKPSAPCTVAVQTSSTQTIASSSPVKTLYLSENQKVRLIADSPAIGSSGVWKGYIWEDNDTKIESATSDTYDYTLPTGSSGTTITVSRDYSSATGTMTYSASFIIIKTPESTPKGITYKNDTTATSAVIKITPPAALDSTNLSTYLQYSPNGTNWTNYSNTDGIPLTVSSGSTDLYVRTNCTSSDATKQDFKKQYQPSKSLKYGVALSSGIVTCTLANGTSPALVQSPSTFSFSTDYLDSAGLPTDKLVISGKTADDLRDSILGRYNEENKSSYVRAAGVITVKNIKSKFGALLDYLPFTTATPNRFLNAATNYSDSGGEVTPRPIIRPGAGETIDPTQGIWIEYPGTETAKIYYTITPDGSATAAVDPATEAGGRTRLYSSSAKIQFPDSSDTFEVRAIAVADKLPASDVVSILYRRDSSFLSPDTPILLLGDTKQSYSYEQTYPADSTVHFQTPGASESIYFTLDGTKPTTNSTKYDTNNPVKLTTVSGRSSVTVMAITYNSSTKRSGAVATYIVRVKQTLGVPAVNVNQSTPIRPSQDLQLSLSDDTLKNLDVNGTYSLKRITYSNSGDINNTDFNEFGSGVVVVGSPIEGTDYISYRADIITGFALPDIKYLVGDGDVTSTGTLYSFGIRKITYSSDSGKYTITYTNPGTIHLSGSPGDTIKVQAYTVSPSTLYNNSSVATYNYKVRGAVAVPSSFPTTDSSNLTALKLGDAVVLTSVADTKIFYTLDGTLPSVSFDAATKTWVPQTIGTLEFTSKITVVNDMIANRVLTINTIAVQANDELEPSAATVFRFQLPEPVKQIIANPSGGTVIKGTKLKLSCLTADAIIFYTLDGVTTPPIEDTGDSSQVYIYDATNPPVIDKDVTIITRAVKDGVSNNPKTFSFVVAPQIAAPSASLATGSIVAKGTRIALSAQGDIAYTIDGSDPKANLAEGGDKAAKVFYGSSVVIDADYGKSVTIRAYTTKTGNTPSEVSSFTYTVCEQNAYLTATPVTGATVSAGTTITLSSSISSAKIYYATGGNAPIAANVYNNSVREDSGDSNSPGFDGGFRWAAGANTTYGSVVKVTGKPGETFTIRATVVANGSQGGNVGLFSYKITERTPSPTASIPNGAITLDGAQVTLTSKEGDIFYTIDGSTPTTSSTLYSAPISITKSCVLKAIAAAKDKEVSEVVQYTYTRAGQAAAVTMSVPAGEVQQGTKLSLATNTNGAIIFYTTDGSEPTKNSLTYSTPISLMRPVTIKTIATLDGLHDSVMNSASYTVTEPEPTVGESGNANTVQVTQTDRLESRRTYAKSGQGNTYTDVIISEPQYNVALSCNEGVVPKEALLETRNIESSSSEKKAVNSLLGYNIASLYDITLTRGGEAIQPTGEVEVGIPIPAEYQNGIVVVCRLNDDGTAEAFPTRRSGGVAYFMTTHFSRYAITVPELSRSTSSASVIWIIVLSAAGTLLLAFILFLIIRRRHNKKKQRAEV